MDSRRRASRRWAEGSSRSCTNVPATPTGEWPTPRATSSRSSRRSRPNSPAGVRQTRALTGDRCDRRATGSTSDAPPRLVSVVVPCRHVGDLLARQLDCLAGQDYACVRRSSSPTTPLTTTWPRSRDGSPTACPPCASLTCSGGSGASYARNVGVAEAWAATFSPSAIPTTKSMPGWIANPSEAGAHDDLVGGAVDEPAFLNDSNGVAARPADGRRHGPAHAARLPTVRGRMNCAIWAACSRRSAGGTRTTRGLRTTSRCRGGPRSAGYTIGFAPPRPSCLTATARRLPRASPPVLWMGPSRRGSLSTTSDPSVWRGGRGRERVAHLGPFDEAGSCPLGIRPTPQHVAGGDRPGRWPTPREPGPRVDSLLACSCCPHRDPDNLGVRGLRETREGGRRGTCGQCRL